MLDSREELIKNIKSISDGGYFNIMLKSLEEAGFISTFIPLGHARRGVHYRLIDEYTLFYLNWIEPLRKRTRVSTTTSYWTSIIHTAAWHAWAGYAFEAVCLKHVDSIKKALGLDNLQVYWGDWRYTPEKGGTGAQIDLVLDRSDDCVMLCEIKHTEKPFVITKSYAQKLKQNRQFIKSKQELKNKFFGVLLQIMAWQRTSILRN